MSVLATVNAWRHPMAGQIKLYTLGRLTIERDGQVLDNFISAKTTLLFVYLAMNPGPHSREALSELLWSETTNVQALKNLRTVLSSLRKHLADALLITRQEVEIDPNVNIWIDARAFLSGIDTANADLSDLERLVTLYSGDFLSNVRVRQAENLENWLFGVQYELQRKYRELLLRVTDICLQQHAYNAGVGYVRELVLLDPYWESAQRRLMRLLTYTNQPHEALLQYERFAHLLAEELGAEPEARTTAVYEQIKKGAIGSRATQTGLHPIVLPDMPYIEPVEDMDYAQRILNTSECRLLTLVGIGGIGKTSLATQLAYRRRKYYQDGTHIIPLASIESHQELALSILNGLKVEAVTTDTSLEDQLLAYLKKRELLLVLDSYEHLLPHTDLIQSILDTAPGVQLLVTSQSQLNLLREWLLPIKGLKLPATADDAAHFSESVQLFDLTARRNFPAFRLDNYLQDVVAICQMLDGLPLGIAIAAGWTQYLSPKEILSMLQQDLLNVKPIHDDLPVRHKGFENLFNSIVTHLSVDETRALTRLAIFKGSFDHQAAIAIAGVDLVEFMKLVDKSLVQRREHFRYTIHNVVRRVFEARLIESGEYDTVLRQFSDYYRQWCKNLLEQTQTLSEQMNAIHAEYHNIWHVDMLADEQRQQYILEIAPTMAQYWLGQNYNIKIIFASLEAGVANTEIPIVTRSHALNALTVLYLHKGRYDAAQWASEQALALEENHNIPIVRVQALRHLCEVSTVRGEYDKARGYLHAILAVETNISAPIGTHLELMFVGAYGQLGTIAMEMAEYDQARHHLQTAIDRSLAMGDTLRAAFGRNNIGIIALKEGDYDEAYSQFSDILPIANEAQHDTMSMIFASNLGEAAMLKGAYQEAIAVFTDALSIAVKIDRKSSIINLMEQFAQLGVLLDKPVVSVQLLAFASALRDEFDMPVAPRDHEEHRRRQTLLQDQLGDDYATCWDRGRTMGVSTAMMVALSLRQDEA